MHSKALYFLFNASLVWRELRALKREVGEVENQQCRLWNEGPLTNDHCPYTFHKGLKLTVTCVPKCRILIDVPLFPLLASTSILDTGAMDFIPSINNLSLTLRYAGIPLLTWTPVLNWYVVRWGSKSKHHKYTCVKRLKETGLCLWIFITTLHSILNTIGIPSSFGPMLHCRFSRGRQVLICNSNR